MLNRAEFNQLKSPLLSHLARTMYIFYLRPQAQQGALSVDPISLTADLVSQSTVMPCTPTLAEIEGALDELEQEHLIARVMPNINWQGAPIIFPLFAQELLEVPHAPFRMYANWQPGPSFRNAALLAGLVDSSYQESELTSFITFWLERTALHNQYGWERVFIQRLMKLRSADAFARVSVSQRRRAAKNASNLQPNTIKSTRAQDAVLPAHATKRGVNNESKVRSNHGGTTQEAAQVPTLRGMISGTPQYEMVAAGYTDEVSKAKMQAAGLSGYQTRPGAPNAELLPRFTSPAPHKAPPASLEPTSTDSPAPSPATPQTSAILTQAQPSQTLPCSGGFDLEYLKELDAAFATTSNTDLIAAEQAATQKPQPEPKPQPKMEAKAQPTRKRAGSSYQRVDFGKLGLEAELS